MSSPELTRNHIEQAWRKVLSIDRLQQSLIAQSVVVPPIMVQRVSAIPRSISGKAPLIKSNLQP